MNLLLKKPKINFIALGVCVGYLLATWQISSSGEKMLLLAAIITNLTLGIMSLQNENCCYVWDDGRSPELYERSHHYNTRILLDKFYDSDMKIAQMWCDEHGYTELEIKEDTPSRFWAFPPHAVMPINLNMTEVRQWYSKTNNARNK